ncbi:hypothetical protein Y032_0004g1882 [Ancylostoma ceylanicum]|uniref:C-type lectin domain-containing protein n=2 Tax=Ancylostoma ceylanicum TaxID=53326 RepID=A0A016VU99_9BILA|nr:hypothetical protein Y032_0004g1882 [Ancylostoma ceylanicum]
MQQRLVMLFKAVSVFCLLFSAVSFPIRNENSCDCSCPGEDLNATVASVTEEPCDCSCDDPVFLIFVDANEVIDDNQTLEVNQSEPCPEGWKTFGSSCYYVETERLVYHEAEANCNEKGAELFAADSLAEWFEVMDFAPSFSWSWTAIFVEDDEVQWRGALDACELNWLWKPFSSEANGFSNDSRCAAHFNMNLDYCNYVRFYSCSSRYFSICKKNLASTADQPLLS